MFLVAGLCAALAGCSVDTLGDCRAICDRYERCYDASYDVARCATSCRASAASDEFFQRKVDQCSTCLSGRECTATAFTCATECEGVVP